MKFRKSLPFPIFKSGGSLRPRAHPQPRPHPAAFCLLLTAYSLLFFSSCKDTGIPPDRIIGPDTTSHNFVWRVDTLGDGNSSVLNDVCIIDENNIWAVGEIYLKDTSGQIDPTPYNVARWNGTQWTLSRVYFTCSGTGGIPFAARAIFGFGPNDIWISSAGTIARWNGSSYTFLCIPSSELPGSINKIWGSSPSDVYVVGNLGTITHFNGTFWQKMESGTNIDLLDIYGAIADGQAEVLAVASYGTQVPQARKLLRVNGMMVTSVPDNGLPLALASVWFAPGVKYFVGGDLLYTTARLGDPWQLDSADQSNYIFSVRGLGTNDMIVAGGFGYFSHYNGSTWKHFMGTKIPRLDGNYYAAGIQPKIVCAVGGIVGGKAITLLGIRN